MTPPVPRWLRVWAVVTVCAALPLAALGAETTTKGVGMADQVSLRTPWYFFTLKLQETPLGLLIEHSHRLFGWAVGFCCIVLAVGLHFGTRTWHRWLGWVALLAVVAQGVFGILRVKWNALAGPELAAFHGCFAQLTFAALVAVAVLVSNLYHSTNGDAKLGRLAVILCVVLFTQIVFGAVVRHLLDPVAQRVHIFLAFAVVVLVVMLHGRLRDAAAGPRHLGNFLAVLIVLQPLLGIEAWLRRFGAGVLPELVRGGWELDLTRSLHHLVGTVLFSTAVGLAVLLCRPARGPAVTLPAPQPLEGAA